ncbi:MAG: class I SAM-dependent methyltransferase [Nanoarchaeota archaeon]|nr:class I SAM-dependent methyltransferase [Nanoarchaeota archaeon]MBU1028272.1 class I SAM-dependent methyltransferase [Nanoarchaeota archaeon]
MEDNKLENTYMSKNPLTRTYFRWKINKVIKISKLKKNDIILDFGCGGGWLEKKLKNFRIYGYDINPEKTSIKDYKKINPTKIFVLDVFEHIPVLEIEKILDNFKKLNKKFDLIVSIPTENLLSRKIRKLVGKLEVPKEHITKHKEILRILKKTFKLRKKINFFTVSHIFLFEYPTK